MVSERKDLANSTLEVQIKGFFDMVLQNPNIKTVLDNQPFAHDCWYLGAGCVSQSVWNVLTDREITYGIGDYDLVYWDANLEKEAEQAEQERVNRLFSGLDIDIEVVNEARVHLWFEEDYCKKIDQLESCEDAINTWPTTASAIAVNKANGKINVYAPYGLNDLFGLVLRPNKPHVLEHVYKNKVKKWTAKWPELRALPYNY